MFESELVIMKYAPESGAIVLFSKEDANEEDVVSAIRSIAKDFGGNVFAGGNAGSIDRVKHIIYAGCERTVFDISRSGDMAELPEADEKFGANRLCVYIPDGFSGRDMIFRASEHVSLFLADSEDMAELVDDITGMDCEVLTDIPEEVTARETEEVVPDSEITSEESAHKQEFQPEPAAEEEFQPDSESEESEPVHEIYYDESSVVEQENYKDEFQEMIREMNDAPAEPDRVISVADEDDFDDYSEEGRELVDDFDDYSDEPFDGYSDEVEDVPAVNPAELLKEEILGEPEPELETDNQESDIVGDGHITWDSLKKNEAGLIPVAVIDHENKDLLMVAWMDEEAYGKTLETGTMTYHSRSRNALWVKGETSGHYQKLVSLTADCDLDTLKAEVIQTGAACHTGSRSCFFNEIVAAEADTPVYQTDNPDEPAVRTDPAAVLYRDLSVINDRKEHPKDGSYTNYLFDNGIDKILKKIGEETSEIIIAAKNGRKDDTVYEFGDLFYHLMVLMSSEGITWDDVFSELENRENERKD